MYRLRSQPGFILMTCTSVIGSFIPYAITAYGPRSTHLRHLTPPRSLLGHIRPTALCLFTPSTLLIGSPPHLSHLLSELSPKNIFYRVQPLLHYFLVWIMVAWTGGFHSPYLSTLISSVAVAMARYADSLQQVT